MPAIRAKFGASATCEGCLVWKNGESINYGGYLKTRDNRKRKLGYVSLGSDRKFPYVSDYANGLIFDDNLLTSLLNCACLLDGSNVHKMFFLLCIHMIGPCLINELKK